jgi:MFS family permease
MMSVLRNRSLLTLAGAELVTSLGSWITSMALFAIMIFEGTGGVGESTAIFLAGLAPSVLLGPVAGWAADRFDRKWLMIASQLLSGLAVSALIFVERLAWIYLILVLHSIAGAAMGPARQAAMPALVDRADLTRANAFMQQWTGGIKMVAPMLAGAVLTILPPRQAIILDVISYALAAAALALLPALSASRSEERPVGAKPGESGWAALRRTVGELNRRAPLLRLIFPGMFLLAVVLMAYDVTAAVFVRDVLRSSSDFFGLSIGLIGAGTAVAGLGLMLVRGERNPWRDLLLGFLLMTAIPLTLALAFFAGNPDLGRAVVLAGSLLGGLGLGVANVQGQTLIQLLAPNGWVGRLGGLFQSVTVAGHITGLLLTPLIVPEPVSFGLFFAVGAGLLILFCLALARVAWGPHSEISKPLADGEISHSAS